MNNQQLLRRFDSFPADLEVEVVDCIGDIEYPCAVRSDDETVTIDTVPAAVAALEQPGLMPYKLYQLRAHLSQIDKPFHAVYVSTYNGNTTPLGAVEASQEKVSLWA